MFDSAPQGHFLRGAPGVHDQDFQLYISMLEGLIVNRWSAAEYLLFPYSTVNPERGTFSRNQACLTKVRSSIGSILIPGPIVVDRLTPLMYMPLAEAGFN